MASGTSSSALRRVFVEHKAKLALDVIGIVTKAQCNCAKKATEAHHGLISGL
jgi:hypothetical protein